MTTQAVNPYLPPWEYIPDAEPHVFGDRLYLYGSHDRFDGAGFCRNDYVCWSAPTKDLARWRMEGTIYRKEQDPRNLAGQHFLYAPDVVQGADHRYYLYYSLDCTGILSVAVCDTPAGVYRYYGDVQWPDGTAIGQSSGDIFPFDPSVLREEDGRLFLYVGFAPRDGRVLAGKSNFEGAYCLELGQNMRTAKSGAALVLPKIGHAAGTGFEGHEFFEASSVRKIKGRYYYVYSSIQSHELCYAISDRPDRGFRFGGTLISNGDVFYRGRKPEQALNYMGNTHGGMVQVKGQWYLFYHRHTNRHCYSRQGCAEKIYFLPDGSIPQVEMTSSGLSAAPLPGKGRYGAYIACNLQSAAGAGFYTDRKEDFRAHPCFTQEQPDHDGGAGAYIANITDRTRIGYKYFELSKTGGISLELRGTGCGKIVVKSGREGKTAGTVIVKAEPAYQMFSGTVCFGPQDRELYLRFEGTGSLDFRTLVLS